MDSVSDRLSNGKRFQALTVIDVFTREYPAIEPGSSLRGEDEVGVPTAVARRRSKPARIYCDNGGELAGKMMDLWGYGKQETLAFSCPGTPTDNAHIESFNGSLRDARLNLHWFPSLTEAGTTLQAWRQDYNESRPHRALDDLSPGDFVDHRAQQRQNFASQVR